MNEEFYRMQALKLFAITLDKFEEIENDMVKIATKLKSLSLDIETIVAQTPEIDTLNEEKTNPDAHLHIRSEFD